MGNTFGRVTKKSTSKFVISDRNFYKLEINLLEQSGIPPEQIVIKDIKVGEYS